MVALIALSLGNIMTALLAFGGPLRWRLGKTTSRQDSSSSSSSWSGEEIIRAIRHEAQINTDPLLPRTRYLGAQALLKINKVIQQEADLHQQQLTMKERLNNGTDIDASTTTSSSSSASIGLQRSKQPHKFSRRLTVQVCLSPGCIADGAAVTMEKLQALAPANVRIQPGGCSSFCGSGPVVVTVLEELVAPSGRPILVEQKSHKRIQNDKILQLVYPKATTAATATADENDDEVQTKSTATAEMVGPPPHLVQGYDLALKGDALFANMEFSKAMEYYEEAVRVGFTSAVELQNERDRFHLYWAQHDHHEQQQPENNNDRDDDSENVEDTDLVTDDDDVKTTTTTTTVTTRIPVELEWLIRARRNEARCKLELGNDIEGAVLAAQASCNLSRNTSSESFHVLAEVYRRKQDLMGEIQALQKMLSLPPPSSSSSSSSSSSAAASSTSSQRQQQFAMENQRRIAGIRLQKLEREYQSQNNRP